jgi:CubicO group peptidase (beta-lactamase class C family)
MRASFLVPNPDLSVGVDNKQGWNQPLCRRAGFHGLHLRARRSLMVRARNILTLNKAVNREISARVDATGLLEIPGFSALVVAEGVDLLFEAAASDFAVDHPHSIQSVTKLYLHLLTGSLIREGRLDPQACVSEYLPEIGSGYACAKIEDLLDMAVENDFTEDYENPLSACYAEEEALGLRLAPVGRVEPTLEMFVRAITGSGGRPPGPDAVYKSANSDVLTLIVARLVPLQDALQRIADAAGYEGAFHVSLSPEGLPALSGGGSLSARDLVRFGLLIGEGGVGIDGSMVGDPEFLLEAMHRVAPTIKGRPGQRYSRHLMTNGRWVGHSGYGGQFLMVDPHKGRVAAFLSVIENPSGYDADLMRDIISSLECVIFDECAMKAQNG